MQSKKGLIFEVACICLIFIIVPFFYNNINANFFTDKKIFENNNESVILMNDFTITAYCPHSCCNDKWAGMTASGKSMDYYLEKGVNIIAVDPEIFPLGSEIIYNNVKYTAVDTGKYIKGKRLDILLPTHEETEKFGIKRNQTIGLVE